MYWSRVYYFIAIGAQNKNAFYWRLYIFKFLLGNAITNPFRRIERSVGNVHNTLGAEPAPCSLQSHVRVVPSSSKCFILHYTRSRRASLGQDANSPRPEVMRSIDGFFPSLV